MHTEADEADETDAHIHALTHSHMEHMARLPLLKHIRSYQLTNTAHTQHIHSTHTAQTQHIHSTHTAHTQHTHSIQGTVDTVCQ